MVFQRKILVFFIILVALATGLYSYVTESKKHVELDISGVVVPHHNIVASQGIYRGGVGRYF